MNKKEKDKNSFAFDRRIEKEKKRVLHMIKNSFFGNYMPDSKYIKEISIEEQKELYKAFNINEDVKASEDDKAEINYQEIFYNAAKEWDKTHELKHINKKFINIIKEINENRRNKKR